MSLVPAGREGPTLDLGAGTARSVRVALVRHAPTEWNATGRAQGRADPPLDGPGRARAASWRLPHDLARRAREGRLSWAASPLRRARETAALLGAVEPDVVPALVERDYGAWTGWPLADLGPNLLAKRTFCPRRPMASES